MTPLEHALNEIDLEEIKREAIPNRLPEHWTLEYLQRLGRPKGIHFKSKKGITNEKAQNTYY